MPVVLHPTSSRLPAISATANVRFKEVLTLGMSSFPSGHVHVEVCNRDGRRPTGIAADGNAPRQPYRLEQSRRLARRKGTMHELAMRRHAPRPYPVKEMVIGDQNITWNWMRITI